MKVSNNEITQETINLMEMIENLQEKYGDVYWIHINETLYVFKPLGRKDYKDIAESDASEMDKQDRVMECCVLYPDIYIDDMLAGEAAELYKNIMKYSYFTSDEERMNIMSYFRSQMFDFQEQVTCMINEAFPNFTIEEIENWGVERTAKYLSRAEWKLQNLRGLEINQDYIEQAQATAQQESAQTPEEQEEIARSKMNSAKSKSGKEKMTPEKLAELKAKFPEIQWDQDVVANTGHIEEESVSNIPPALRPGF